MSNILPNKAIYFDRDGIVNKRVPGGYVRTPDEFVFLPEVLPLLNFARTNHFLSIVISNQQGVGKGLMSEEQLDVVTEYMQSIIIQKFGWAFDDVFCALELDGEQPLRRKPEPAMIIEAAQQWYIDNTQSWMIGDSISDAIAGKAAGCKTILIGDFENEDGHNNADYIVPDHDSALLVLQANAI